MTKNHGIKKVAEHRNGLEIYKVWSHDSVRYIALGDIAVLEYRESELPEVMQAPGWKWAEGMAI